MHLKNRLITSLLVAAGFAVPAMATQQGDWLMRVGLTNVSPNAGSSGVVADDAIDVGDDTQPSISFTYMYSDNLGVEILAALPFTHDIILQGAGVVGEAEHLPPTISLEYQFSPGDSIRPYASIGVNYTTFLDQSTSGALAGVEMNLDDSVGLAVTAGLDMDINKDWFFNASVRYANIETTADLTGVGKIDVEINPYIFTLGAGTRF